jgi:hypothetical protein
MNPLEMSPDQLAAAAAAKIGSGERIFYPTHLGQVSENYVAPGYVSDTQPESNALDNTSENLDSIT